MPVTKIVLRNAVLAVVALPALALSACGGEGDYVPTPYHNVPYTHERTAGTGIAYVRASMLPRKEAKVETMLETKAPVAAPAEPATPPPPPIVAGDKVFDKKQSK